MSVSVWLGWGPVGSKPTVEGLTVQRLPRSHDVTQEERSMRGKKDVRRREKLIKLTNVGHCVGVKALTEATQQPN